jgi:hypothetical protein
MRVSKKTGVFGLYFESLQVALCDPVWFNALKFTTKDTMVITKEHKEPLVLLMLIYLTFFYIHLIPDGTIKLNFRQSIQKPILIWSIRLSSLTVPCVNRKSKIENRKYFFSCNIPSIRLLIVIFVIL